MNSELLSVIDYIEQERGINRELLIEAIEKAILTSSKKSIHPAKELEVKVDKVSGDIKAWALLEVVEDNPNNDQVSIKDVEGRNIEAEIGETIKWEVTPENFGRIAAQTAKQAIMQQLKRAEKAVVKEEFQSQVGEIINGVVRRFENGGIIVDLYKAEGFIGVKDKIPGEQYSAGDRINALLIRVEVSGSGPSLILSRSANDFIKRLFEREVSEIHDGIVEIKGIAREPGLRTKIAVKSNDPRVDPIGACVGMRGMRVKSITSELNGERIDIIRYDEDIRTYAANALQPAKPKGIEIDEEKHQLNVYVTPDQSRLAFGKRAQNVRLSSKLVGWNLKIIEEREEVEESFEEKIERAISALAEKIGIDVKLASKLVSNGFNSVEGLKAVDKDDLLKIEGFTEADAEQLQQSLENL